MKKKTTALVTIGIILIMVIVVGIFYNELNKNKFGKNGELLFPGAVLTGMNKDANGNTSLAFETFDGDVAKFYQEELNNEGWKKIEDLGQEDMTNCGGDWGGIYKKAEMKIKVHVCGFDTAGALNSIFLIFYDNLKPEDVLGNDFFGASPNCIVDGVINSIEACDTGASIRFKLAMNSDKINNFRINLGTYAWKEAKNVNNSQGIVEFETPYEKGWEWGIKDASVYPTVNSGFNSFDCSSSRKEVKIVKCN